MRDYLRLFGHSIRHTLDFAGRATRAEALTYLVLSQALFLLIAWPAAWFAPDLTKHWIRFATQVLIVVPAIALIVRRLHDFGFSGRWSLILLAVAVRNFTLDLLALIGGWDVRSAVESPLAYVDWLLFLPFVALYFVLLVAPGTKGSNQYGADPRGANSNETAGPESPGPAA